MASAMATAGRLHNRPWLMVVGATLTYDVWLIRQRDDSLSRHFASMARAHPVGLLIGVGYTLAHLSDLLPDSLDLFMVAAKRVAGAARDSSGVGVGS